MTPTVLSKKCRWTPACAAILAAIVALGVPAAAATVTDQGVGNAIENELLFDRAVSLNDIDVSVTNGIATLTGKASNILAKERAARIAETVKGVRSVVNRVKVEPTTSRSDAAIEGDVESALLSDPATDSYEVDAAVADGVVTLTGTVQSWTEKELAAKVAKGVRGVIDLENQIDVRYKTNRADIEIKPEISQALRWDVLVDHALIDVNVENGAVTLTGTVGSAAEKRRARHDCWVSGVTSVDASGLKVARWARDEDLRKNKYVTKSAKQIETAIEDALTHDPRVFSFNVSADVSGSTVTLRGAVDNLKAKRAAGQIARNTVGVTYVTNRLKVRPIDALTDGEIANDIRDALLRDAYVERYDITVSVINGVAYLGGTVDSYFEKWRADDVAAKVNGVVEVRNHLDVDYEGPLAYEPYADDDYPYTYDWYDYQPNHTFKTDAEIAEDIEDELWWSPFVDENEVKVTVEDGVATLKGTVDSRTERGAAADNAYEGGATWVDNELKVK